ncbi:MAG: SMC-Scp complex subunit ScpB, partial [Acidobacteriaceae bacterium]
ALGDVNAIRGIESAGTVQTLRNRKLIAREARLGPRREKLWRTTQIFLETFGLASLNELYEAGRMEEVFAPVYSAELGEEEGADTSDHTEMDDREAP